MKVALNKVSEAYWRISFNNPPINLLNQEMLDELTAHLVKLEATPM